jgi:hypothetical protein
MLERHGGGGAFIALKGNLAVRVPETRTCLGRGPDMSGQPLYNPATELNKAERPNMSGLEAGYV